jgi:AraC-like DNA-binding protein
MKTKSSWIDHFFAWEVARGIEVILTIIYRREVPANAEHLTVTQPLYTWWWILAGEVLVKTEEETMRIRAGHWLLIPAALRRTQQFRSGSRIVSINFIARWANGLPLVDMPRLLSAASDTVAHLSTLANQVCKAAGGEDDPHQVSLRGRKLSICNSLELNSSLNRFVKVLLGYAINCGGRLQTFTTDDGRLDHVLKSIRSELHAGPLPYDEWQKQTGLGRSQLDRLAKTHLRISLHRYRDQLLIAEACRRLAAQETVKQTAAVLGFVDSAHFCRWVRHHMGRSPLSLRSGPTL